MPTGYTAELYDGKEISFEQFVLNCARAMGAAIMQRDDGPGPIADEYEPSDYYQKSVIDAETRLAEYHGRTAADWQADESASRSEQAAHVADAIKKAADRRVRYETMLAEIEAWVPPTTEHQGLKDFMLQQITESIKFDCSATYLTIPPRRGWEAYKADRIAESEKSLQRANEGWTEEQERTAGRNKWVRDLRESLGEIRQPGVVEIREDN